MERRDWYYDGDIRQTLVAPPVVALIVLVLFLLSAESSFLAQGSVAEVEAYNANIEVFNNLPLADREAIGQLPYMRTACSDDSYLIQPKEMPKGSGEIFQTFFARSTFVILFFIVSMVTLIVYSIRKKSEYFLADLPLGTLYGRILLLVILPVGWPFLLVSFARMKRCFRNIDMAEKKELQRLANDFEENLQGCKANSQAQHLYVAMRVEKLSDTRNKEIKDCYARADSLRNAIASYGKQIQEKQRMLGECNARIRELEEKPCDTGVVRAEALQEWKEILEMRGVSKITASGPKIRGKDRYIEILIKVRVPYDNSLYDFGDYCVRFYADRHFECRRVRSGVRKNHTNTVPIYNDSRYGFCFGGRIDTIQHFVSYGRYLEALTIIIDCFHSVNSGHEVSIPGCYRKIKSITDMKKRTEPKNRKGGKRK